MLSRKGKPVKSQGEKGATPPLFDVRQGERPKVFLMFAYFFLVITVFQILKPMKKGLFLETLGAHAAEWELVAKLANMGVAVGAAAVFSLLAGRLRRDRLVLVFALFFTAAFLAYSRLLGPASEGLAGTAWLGGHFRPAVAWSFYLLGDLFSTVMVPLFFAFLNDITPPEQARRLYGLIGAGGVIGGYVGNTVVRVAVAPLGSAALLLVCIGILGTIVLIARTASGLHERAAGVRAPDGRAPGPDREPAGAAGEGGREARTTRPSGGRAPRESGWREAVEGARLVARSRYLLAIVGIIGLYEICSTVLDYQYSATVVHFVEGVTDKQVFFARVGQAIGIVSIVSQIFLTTFLLGRHGVGAALLVLPLAILASSTGFLVAPTLLVAAVLSISDNGLAYSVNQTSKEVLYTPTTREEKYKAKAFIDMFVQRFAKALAVGISLAASALVGFEGLRTLSLGVIGVLVVWILTARYASREFGRRTAGRGDTSRPVSAAKSTGAARSPRRSPGPGSGAGPA